jgi:hypothetical protein
MDLPEVPVRFPENGLGLREKNGPGLHGRIRQIGVQDIARNGHTAQDRQAELSAGETQTNLIQRDSRLSRDAVQPDRLKDFDGRRIQTSAADLSSWEPLSLD